MSDDFRSNPLVTTEWLAANINSPDLRVIDASYYLPGEGLDPRYEFEQHHIPGAVFFDIDDIADSDNPLPHMLPSPIKFSSKVRKLGLGDGLRYVVYDQRGIWSAPRVWWTFRYFGHRDVAVLDGGLPKWMAEGHPVEDGPVRKDERHFTPRVDSFLVKDKDQIEGFIKSGRAQILDARSKGRFEGADPEPRPGLRSGHMPGAISLPHGSFINGADQTMKSSQERQQVIADAGVDMKKPVVTSCGSGITAAVLCLALTLEGHKDVALYDGSWSEWGMEGDHPVVTGPEA